MDEPRVGGDQEVHAPDEDAPFADDPPVDNSFLTRLRAQHAALAEKQTLDLPIPGYELTARYAAIDYATVDKITERAQKASKSLGSQADLNAAADVLARTCQCIYERRENGELIPLNTLMEKWGDDPIVYDSRLVEAVGCAEGETARQIIHNVFRVHEPRTKNSMVLMGHQTQILQWLREADEDVNADF